MIQKPKIQYVGQFYVHGSEARQLELEKQQKKAKTKLPLARLERIQKIYVDPVALVSIVVSVVMLVVMVVGAMQIQTDWEEYERTSAYLSQLKKENAELDNTYRRSYDLEEVKSKALALGMVSVEELETRTITVTLPEPEPETTWIDDLIWFWEGLWA